MAECGSRAATGGEWKDFQFKSPVRLIKTEEDLDRWLDSQVCIPPDAILCVLLDYFSTNRLMLTCWGLFEFSMKLLWGKK